MNCFSSCSANHLSYSSSIFTLRTKKPKKIVCAKNPFSSMINLLLSVLITVFASGNVFVFGNVLDGYQLVFHEEGVLTSFSFVQGNTSSSLKIGQSEFGNFGSLPLTNGSHRLVRFRCVSVNYICNCSNNDTFSLLDPVIALLDIPPNSFLCQPATSLFRLQTLGVIGAILPQKVLPRNTGWSRHLKVFTFLVTIDDFTNISSLMGNDTSAVVSFLGANSQGSY
jgi:hypothetical protein